MIVTQGSDAPDARACALTIGNFDGVHRGHQAMVARVLAIARERGLDATVLTFEPHPREFFAAESAPTRLTSLREKTDLLAELGLDRLHVQPFDDSFAALSPGEFIDRVLVRTLRARWLLVGDDFRFGAKRAGDYRTLVAAGPRCGIEIEAMETIADRGARISSSAIRAALAAGELAKAEALLGRPYSIAGRVVDGLKLGRQLGFATANIELEHNRPPLLGIFAVRVHGLRGSPWPGVASLGYRPTVVRETEPKLEVHLLDFDEDIYGATLRVEFLLKIRDEEKYADLETLKAAIARDCEVARRYHRDQQHA